MLSAADQGAGRAAMGNTTSPPHLFISYSSTDGSTFAQKFERCIEMEGLTSWRDLIGVEGGEESWISVLRGRHGLMMLE